MGSNVVLNRASNCTQKKEMRHVLHSECSFRAYSCVSIPTGWPVCVLHEAQQLAGGIGNTDLFVGDAKRLLRRVLPGLKAGHCRCTVALLLHTVALQAVATGW